MKSQPRPSAHIFEDGKRGSVLLITLAFVLLVTVMAVAFLVRSRSSLQTSQGYSREMIAKEVGEIGINTLAAQFQKEASTNLTNSTNLLLPLRTGLVEQNPRLSPLIRQTTDTNAISSNATAKNGWRFENARWKASALLTDAQYNAQAASSLPQWVYVFGNATASGSGNAPADVIGRYAAMVYDLGGLIDINEAGAPKDVPKGDKGSVAFADLSAFTGGTGWPESFYEWHGGNVTAEDYYGAAAVPYGNSTYIAAVDPKQAGRLASSSSRLKFGENRFFSRMELIEAGRAGKLGLSESLLPLLRTRSEAANRLSVESLFAYGTNSAIDLAHTDLKAAKDLTFTVSRIDGATENYTIKAGQPVIQNRFPLARLRWLADREEDGTPRHQPEIQKYFGLTWDPISKIFIYTSPDGTAAVDKIKTLKDLAIQINGPGPVREPDFFEWLKAAINPDSLGQSGGTTDRLFATTPIDSRSSAVSWEISKDLHILRIGENIIDQSDPDSIPTGIRSQFTNVDPAPFDSFGQENLPYINEVIATVLRSGDELKGYLQFEMWNPHRNAATGENPPLDFQGNRIRDFRVRAIKGDVLMEPMVYVRPKFSPNYYQISSIPGIAGQEGISYVKNPEWNSLKGIVQESQKNLNATPLDIKDAAVNFSLGTGGGFFGEPYLVNGNQPNGQDATGEVTMTMSGGGFNISLSGLLGATPEIGKNAMLVSSIHAPNPAFDKLKMSDVYAYKGAGSPPAWFNKPSGAKSWNAVQFYGDGTGGSSAVTLAVELQDAGGKWRPCQIYNNLCLNVRSAEAYRLEGVVLSADPSTLLEQNWESASDPNSCFRNWSEWQIRKGYSNTDPRTERFGLSSQSGATPGMGIRTHTDQWQGTGGNTWNLTHGLADAVGKKYGISSTPITEVAAPRWFLVNKTATGGAAGSVYLSVPADLVLNSGDSGTHYYQDDDGKTRPADARWVPSDAHPALPVASFAKAAEARPIFLNRPFRSVAELGSVFRDIPWKSLDLFSPDSPDRRLLDVFSVEDRATVTGKINPNLATDETLKALLRGASLDPSSAGASSVANSDADAVASIFSILAPASNPVLSSANMTARLSTNSVSKPDGGFSPYKTRAENFIRALSSTIDTRNWQLMLDVVAQSGRITPQNGPLTSFVVEGQKRFFVYLTLDRITGEIVDKHIEPVYE